MAKAKIFAAIRRLNEAHREEVERLYRAIYWNDSNDRLYANTIVKLQRTAEHLSQIVPELIEEVKSLKRMMHAETVLRANVKPDAAMEKPDGSRALNPNTDMPTE
jgi:hypothetical protein